MTIQNDVDDDKEEPTFVNCNGLRYAIPYDSTTTPTFIKDRFIGQTLDVVLGTMFRRKRGTQPIPEAAAHWYSEIQAGRVAVRGKKTSRDDPWEFQVATIPPKVVTKGISVRLQLHVHEKVVPAKRIDILVDTEKWLAINKPGGLATINENGVTSVNSLTTMVTEECSSRAVGSNSQKKLNLQPAHRLDKPVSGVLLIGKSPKNAANLLREIQRGAKGESGGVEKIYVARVRRNPESIGLVQANKVVVADDFPQQVTVEAELGWDNPNKRAVVMDELDTEKSAERASVRKTSIEGLKMREAKKKKRRKDYGHKQLLDDGGKVTKTHTTHTTRFRRLGETRPDGTVLVECLPLTGQRHQIRAHLAAIGWPIANDCTYGGTFDEKVGTRLWAYVDNEAGTLQHMLGSSRVLRSWCTKCQWTMQMLSPGKDEDEDEGTASSEVKDKKGVDLRRLPVEGAIWLHSYRYVLPAAELDIVAPLPDWAQPSVAV